jgi:hypothetical protein
VNNSLFLPDEPNKDLKNLYFKEQPNFSSLDYNLFISYDKQTFKRIIEILFEFNLSYDNFFKNKKTINDEDRPDYKLHIAKSNIRIAFSKEKSIYIEEKYFELQRNIQLNKELFLFESKRNFINEFFISFNVKDIYMLENTLNIPIIILIKSIYKYF